MNRTALCINMLQILNAHDMVSSNELAERLETNRRNIQEFKRELETAGYNIESKCGKNGGYRLLDKAYLPAIELTQQEKHALDDAYRYLKSHHDFLSIHDYTKAIEKIHSSLDFESSEQFVLYHNENNKIEAMIQQMIELCEMAKQNKQVICFDYHSLHAQDWQAVELWPYEIMNIRGAYYCLGYCPNKHDFRIYKFSVLRMKNMQCIDKYFTRDLNFNAQVYLGKSGLMKDEVVEAEFLIRGEQAILYAEAQVGIHPIMKFVDDHVLHVKTYFEGKLNALQFLCSLGSSCEVLSPISLREEMKEEIKKMAQNYLSCQ